MSKINRRKFLATTGCVVPGTCLLHATVVSSPALPAAPSQEEPVSIACIKAFGSRSAIDSKIASFPFDTPPNEDDLSLLTIPVHAHLGLSEALLHPLSSVKDYGQMSRKSDWVIYQELVATVPTNALKNTWFKDPDSNFVPVHSFRPRNEQSVPTLNMIGNALRYKGTRVLYAARDLDLNKFDFLWTTLTLWLITPAVLCET
jgi:hypothetical protein